MKENLTIILIDDDQDDQYLFKRALHEVDENIRYIGLEDCRKALRFLRDSNNTVPDFIFLDLRVPGYSSRKCLEDIKQEERLKHIPVIIYTTSSDVDHSASLIESGAVHFISKPANPEEIYYLVSTVLNENWN